MCYCGSCSSWAKGASTRGPQREQQQRLGEDQPETVQQQVAQGQDRQPCGAAQGVGMAHAGAVVPVVPGSEQFLAGHEQERQQLLRAQQKATMSSSRLQ